MYSIPVEELTHLRASVKQTRYLKKNPLRRCLLGRYLASILELVEQSGAHQILDVGCGEGFVLRYLREHSTIPVAGIDIDRSVLNVARHLNSRNVILQGDISGLPLAEESYDLILCNQVLEHLGDPLRALEELQRVAGRHCIISVPREPHYRITNLLIGSNISRWGDDADHRQRWTRSAFHHVLSSFFRVVSIKLPFPYLMALCEVR